MILKTIFIILLSGSIFATDKLVEFRPGLVAGPCEVGHHQVLSHKVMNTSSIQQINKAMGALIQFSQKKEMRNPRQEFLHGEINKITKKLIGHPMGYHSLSDPIDFAQEFLDIL